MATLDAHAPGLALFVPGDDELSSEPARPARPESPILEHVKWALDRGII